MQEETTSSNDSSENLTAKISHSYYEVGRELLSKPNLLCDIVESLESYPVLIYCNTPSDTDFVEVMLKKRGIGAQKLIGNVPQDKIDKTFDLINKNELSAIVLTDIAARIIDLQPFKVGINYSVPQDAGTYSDRCALNRPNSITRILTLVSPLELANFHFLKKSLSLEPELAPPPSTENLLKARITNLKNTAIAESHLKNDAIKSMVDLLLTDQNKEEIIALLINNTINVLPAAKSSQNKNDGFDDEEDSDFVRQGSDRDRWKERGSKSSGRGERYRSRDRYNYDDSDSSDYQNNGNGDTRNDHRHNKRRTRDERPVKKDARIYLGKGSEQGISKENILNILKECSLDADSLKHLSIRNNYTFFDVDDEKSAEVLEKIKALETADINYSGTKAITINAAVENADDEAAQAQTESPKNQTQEIDSSQADTLEESEEDQNFGNR